jgi:hypothetical protein
LQELLASSNVVFISNDWKTVLGDKESLDELLSEITGIGDDRTSTLPIDGT